MWDVDKWDAPPRPAHTVFVCLLNVYGFAGTDVTLGRLGGFKFRSEEIYGRSFTPNASQAFLLRLRFLRCRDPGGERRSSSSDAKPFLCASAGDIVKYRLFPVTMPRVVSPQL